MPTINPVQLLSFAEKHPKNYHISHIPFNPNTFVERRTSLGGKTIDDILNTFPTINFYLGTNGKPLTIKG